MISAAVALLLLFLSRPLAAADCGPPPTPPASCGAFHDVVIAFDNSEKPATVDEAMSYLLTDLVNRYSLQTGGTARVAIVSFSGINTAQTLHPLTDSRPSLLAAINARPPSNGGTCTRCGLQAAQQVLSESERAGMHPSPRPVIVLLSDGLSTSGGGWAYDAHIAGTIRDQGIRIIALSLAPEAETAVASMASDPPSANSFPYTDIAEARTALATDDWLDAICDEIYIACPSVT